jgi:hypothetical protein
MTSASALLLLQPGHAAAVPAKVYEYLAAGRPILAIAEDETAAIVQGSGLGITAPSDDETAIVDALARLWRTAAQPVTPPRRELFDGALRAAQAGAHLSEIMAARAASGAMRRRGADRDARTVTALERRKSSKVIS